MTQPELHLVGLFVFQERCKGVVQNPLIDGVAEQELGLAGNLLREDAARIDHAASMQPGPRAKKRSAGTTLNP